MGLDWSAAVVKRLCHLVPRLAGPAAVLLLLPVGLSLLGCPAAGFPRDDADAGPDSRTDAAAADAAAPDVETGPPVAELDSASRGCLDGEDADGNGVADCQDDACTAAPVCCVGATSTACCTSVPGELIPLTACSATRCGESTATFFGAPSLELGFRGTSDAADSGVVLGEGLDGRAGRVEVRAQVVLGAATVPEPELDWVAVGFVASASGSARVLPAAALQVNAALDRIALVVGDAIVAEAPGAASGEYVLAIEPSGDVTGGLVGGTPLTGNVSVGAGLRPVVYGRSVAADGITVSSVTVTRSACDVPAALELAPIELVDEALVFAPGTEANPSLARGPDGVLYLAFDAVRLDDPGRRSLFVAQETAPGRFVVRNPSTGLAQPIVSLADRDELIDPDLSFEGTSWHLLFAGERGGRREIFAAESTEAQPSFATPQPVEVDVTGFDSFDAPTRVPGGSQMLVRAHGPDGTSLLLVDVTEPNRALMASDLCGVDDPCELSASSRFVVQARAGTGLFDADEVASPSVVRDADDLFRLYYTGRRANRWTVTVVISENGDYWRRLSETAREAPSDEVLGPDDRLGALGFRSIGTLLEESTLSLVVEGWSGTRSRFSFARQSL
jgi:hypothetical protein